MTLKSINEFLNEKVTIAPIVTFRVLYGFMMVFSIIRFTLLGWIERQYLEPSFQFKYYGFEWIVTPPPGILYAIYIVMFLAAVGIMLGWYYRISTILFFVAFSYVELLDKSFYLNHYYFISVVAFILIFVPANRRLSLDVKYQRVKKVVRIERIYLMVLRLQVAVVYFFAGIAKINYDWLINGMPMRIWLPANSHIPILGKLFTWKATAYVFSWFGMLYDTTIVLFLCLKRTRWLAYATVIVFHLMTALLFPIGVFPIVMICSALIFFPGEWHEKIVTRLDKHVEQESVRSSSSKPSLRWKKPILIGFMILQLLFPIRYLMYPGNLFWTEEGYLFSWRVMLTEKLGNAQFYVTDRKTGKKIHIDNREHLIPTQEKMMSTKPDFIIQYAKYLKQTWIEKGFEDPIVTADIFVTLNGRRSKRFVDPSVDLALQEDTWKHKEWILED
ncbi:MAG: HTTM domain-containing protein [Bacteroidota bacterium]